jgi:hypothetical protein
VAGAPRVAERIDALAEPEAKRDQDTSGMKQGEMRLQERDWRRLGLTSANTFPIPETIQAREPAQPNSSIEAAFEAKAKKFIQAGRALAELENLVAGKVREWEQAGLVEALELGTEIHNVIKKYCEGLNSSNKNTAGSNIPNGAKGNIQSWAQVAASTNSKEAGPTKAPVGDVGGKSLLLESCALAN